ncbi:hypothetical protein [Verminephrobacter aporrectodeae]|uniref:hypothetical protein n=1 Tax=Verminephrobacter aporrectodeae TaxID=1110389 RepID=UPI002244367D|nr:hypothetical protein [Verminephrobacter aporrectodeae]MCW8176102.1 hypothetical protein [Verminephrobacter aporrectodeae subsp. tuberculatae]MCW8203086.1 hypothetical protein [Verminephrobacter aporrectodeae subsp. tuberculatae]
METAVQTVQGWLGAPWFIWSGVISAVVATSVAALTTCASNKHSLALLKKQHARDNEEANRQREHDAKQKDEDRKGAIRREVYASAVVEAHELLRYLGGLPDRPLYAGNDADSLYSFLKANAKIWLIADAEAAHLSQDLEGDFTKVFFDQLHASRPIRELMEPVRRQEENIAFAKSEARRLASQLTDARAKNAGQEEQKKLLALMEEINKYAEELTLVRQQEIRKILPLRMEAFTATFGKFRSVQRTLAKLVSALRKELNLPRDDDEFMKQLKDKEQLKDEEQQAWAMVNKAHGIDPPGPMPEIVEPGWPSGR